MIQEQSGIDVAAEVDAKRVTTLANGAPHVVAGCIVLVAFTATDEALALLDEGFARVECRLCGKRHVLEPGVTAATLAGLVDMAIVVDDERALVGVDRDRQLGDIAVV